MDNGNETVSKQCCFLNEDHFSRLYDAFIEAFSDYVFRFALTEVQFRNHIILNAVDLERSVGIFNDETLVGFSLNGFGEWEGKATVYDAGTGVIPTHRRRGYSEHMFGMMIPVFRTSGIRQFLLEVVTSNAAAIDLYEKLGFRTSRRLLLLQCDKKLAIPPSASTVSIREITQPDWPALTKFWDGRTSWQNSVEAVERSRKMKRILGAFVDGQCVGYIVFSSKFGRVAQLAVHKELRNRGIGSSLLRAMEAETADGFSMQIINIDSNIETAIAFFRNRGFYERLSQYEMIKEIV